MNYTEAEIIEYAYDLADEWGNYFDESAMAYLENRGAVLFFYPDERDLVAEWRYLSEFEASFPYAEVQVDVENQNIQTRNRTYGRYDILRVTLTFLD